jgi:hypothetical protein
MKCPAYSHSSSSSHWSTAHGTPTFTVERLLSLLHWRSLHVMDRRGHNCLCPTWVQRRIQSERFQASDISPSSCKHEVRDCISRPSRATAYTHPRLRSAVPSMDPAINVRRTVRDTHVSHRYHMRPDCSTYCCGLRLTRAKNPSEPNSDNRLCGDKLLRGP